MGRKKARSQQPASTSPARPPDGNGMRGMRAGSRADESAGTAQVCVRRSFVTLSTFSKRIPHLDGTGKRPLEYRLAFTQAVCAYDALEI